MDVSCKGDGGGSKGKPELLLGELGIELIAYDGLPLIPNPQTYISLIVRVESRFVSPSITYFPTFKENISIPIRKIPSHG